MGEAACSLLVAELALDRVDAELATELPSHVRAFAHAHAAGAPPPPAPAIARRASSLASARRALPHPLLADRALALMRLLAPIAIEDDARVIAARTSVPTWDALAILAAARDAAARARFDHGYVALIHRLHGSSSSSDTGAWPPPIDGWHSPCEPIDPCAIERVWSELATRHGASGGCLIVRASQTVRPRTFVVEPGREVIVVVPSAIETPAARFEVLHELGHALAALLTTHPLPRVVDEAAGAYVARLLESDDALPDWHTPLAAIARTRRLAIAKALDAIERGASTRPTTKPPWALWHDAGAQAAYVNAESLAERWSLTPEPAAFAAVLALEQAHIDRTTML